VTTVANETVRAFVPYPLPPVPPVQMTSDRQRLLERAQLACGRLDAITALLPDPDVFLYSYVRREAVLSSQIEGTQSSLSDLLLFEIKGVQAARIRGASPICARRRAHRWKACWVRRGGRRFSDKGAGIQDQRARTVISCWSIDGPQEGSDAWTGTFRLGILVRFQLPPGKNDDTG
jgi:hypothetical protein